MRSIALCRDKAQLLESTRIPSDIPRYRKDDIYVHT